MHEVVIEEDTPEGGEPPSYDTPGRILVHFLGTTGDQFSKYECEVLDYDVESSVFYINEGVGFDYWLDNHAEFTEPGYYVIEGITGQYIKGDWSWREDDDETWEVSAMRRATDAEVISGALPAALP